METTENVMGTKKIMPLLLSMSVPPMISMMIQALYNIVDSIFVARISPDALTAVSLAFPLQNLVLAVAVGFGVGLNACIARNLGAKNQKGTNNTATLGFVFTLIHGVIFVFISFFFTAPFIRMFSQGDEVYRMACDYSFIVITCAFASLFHLYVEKIFQATGNMLIPMLMQALGAIINIILDPILIFGLFGFPMLGVRGAAIATVSAQFIACLTSFLLFFIKNNGVKLRFKELKFDKETIKNLYIIAVPSGIMMALPSVLVSILNGILGNLSHYGVGVFGAYYKLQTFIYMPANGVIQGMRPIMSYNYGAKKYDRIKKTLKASLQLNGTIMFLGTILFLCIPTQIMSLFNNDPEILKTGTAALRIISLGFVVSTIPIVLSSTFEALGKGIHSLIVSLIRLLLIIPPLSFILSRFMGLYGVWMAFPVAEIIAAIAAFFIYRHLSKSIFNKD